MHPSHLAFSRLKRLVSIARGVTARTVIGSLKQRGQRLIGPCPIHTGEVTRRPSSPISQKISGTALPVVAVAAMGSSGYGAWTTANTLKSPATWPPWPRSRQYPQGSRRVLPCIRGWRWWSVPGASCVRDKSALLPQYCSGLISPAAGSNSYAEPHASS